MAGVASAVPLSKRLGKKTAFIASAIAMGVLSVMFFYVPVTNGGMMTMLLLQILISIFTGETQTITFSLAANDLAFVGYDGRWRLEEGDFVLSAGTQQVKVVCEKTFVWNSPNR